MKVTLTRAQMLAEWLRRRAIEPLRLDCTVHRADGPDVEAIAAAEMRTRYLSLLDSAPAALLAPAMVPASELQLTVHADGRTALLTPPEGTRRVLWVECGGAAPLVPSESMEAVVRAAANPMWHRPVAALTPDGRVALAALAAAELTAICAIIDRGPEIYEFDDALWKELIY